MRFEGLARPQGAIAREEDVLNISLVWLILISWIEGCIDHIRKIILKKCVNRIRTTKQRKERLHALQDQEKCRIVAGARRNHARRRTYCYHMQAIVWMLIILSTSRNICFSRSVCHMFWQSFCA